MQGNCCWFDSYCTVGRGKFRSNWVKFHHLAVIEDGASFHAGLHIMTQPNAFSLPQQTLLQGKVLFQVKASCHRKVFVGLAFTTAWGFGAATPPGAEVSWQYSSDPYGVTPLTLEEQPGWESPACWDWTWWFSCGPNHSVLVSVVSRSDTDTMNCFAECPQPRESSAVILWEWASKRGIARKGHFLCCSQTLPCESALLKSIKPASRLSNI